MQNDSRVGANVRWLYLRLVIETLADLITVRILLTSLGACGYGSFAAVVGSVGTIGFFTGAFEAAARRFVCCSSSAFSPILGLTFFIVIALGMIVGLVSVVVLPYEASVSMPILGIVIIRILRIPYEACIVASERMRVFLFVSTVECTLTLGSALILFLLPFDSLKTYAGLRFATVLFAGVLVVGFVLRRHPVSRVCPVFGLDLVKPLFRFFSWHALGALAGLLKGNGIVILLAACSGAMYCGAWDASMKIGVFLWGLIANFRTAYLPGIVKAWASGNRLAFVGLTEGAFRCSLIGATLVCLPIVVFAQWLCWLWLGSAVPNETPMFLRMVVVQFFFEALATPYDAAILASGRIARYEIVLTMLIGSSFFMAWLALASGLPPWTSSGAVALVNFFAFLYRLLHLRHVRMPDGTHAW